jgi:hypothetical protein
VKATRKRAIEWRQRRDGQVEKKTRELGITRADLIGLLIDKYADKVTKEYPSAGTWVLTLGDNRLRVESHQPIWAGPIV